MSLESEIMNKPRILIIIAYFGKLPSCFKYFCKSVFANEGVLDVLLVTDQDVQSQNNLYVHKSTLRNLQERLVKFVHENSEISFNQKNIFRASSRKICDIKVAYKFLFEDEINSIRKYHENDYVGYGDLDVIFGNISSYMNGDHEGIPPLRDFEILGLHGHFTAIKFGSIIWKDILTQDWFFESLVGRGMVVLDEGNFRKYLITKAGVYQDKDEKFLNDWRVCRRGTDKWHGSPALYNFYKNEIPLVGLFYGNMMGNLSIENNDFKITREWDTEGNLIESRIDKLIMENSKLYYLTKDTKKFVLYCHLGSVQKFNFLDIKQ